jgi:hypothetical protein
MYLLYFDDISTGPFSYPAAVGGLPQEQLSLATYAAVIADAIAVDWR